MCQWSLGFLYSYEMLTLDLFNKIKSFFRADWFLFGSRCHISLVTTQWLTIRYYLFVLVLKTHIIRQPHLIWRELFRILVLIYSGKAQISGRLGSIVPLVSLFFIIIVWYLKFCFNFLKIRKWSFASVTTINFTLKDSILFRWFGKWSRDALRFVIAIIFQGFQFHVNLRIFKRSPVFQLSE